MLACVENHHESLEGFHSSSPRAGVGGVLNDTKSCCLVGFFNCIATTTLIEIWDFCIYIAKHFGFNMVVQDEMNSKDYNIMGLKENLPQCSLLKVIDCCKEILPKF